MAATDSDNTTQTYGHPPAKHLISCKSVQAASEGRWLLLEGLDLAPADLLASLVPLLESRQMPSQRQAASGPCHPDFRFIATVTSLPGEWS